MFIPAVFYTSTGKIILRGTAIAERNLVAQHTAVACVIIMYFFRHNNSPQQRMSTGGKARPWIKRNSILNGSPLPFSSFVLGCRGVFPNNFEGSFYIIS